MLSYRLQPLLIQTEILLILEVLASDGDGEIQDMLDGMSQMQ
jgi:hypothetical protein